VQFVMGVKNAMPVDRDVFNYYARTVARLAPDAEWCGAGIGPHQLTLNEWCVAAGGLARTGLEDNVRLGRDRRGHRDRRGQGRQHIGRPTAVQATRPGGAAPAPKRPYSVNRTYPVERIAAHARSGARAGKPLFAGDERGFRHADGGKTRTINVSES